MNKLMSGSSFLILDCPPGKAGVNSKQNQVNNLLINSQSATNTTKATVTLEFNDQQRQTHKTSRQDVNSQAESKSINQSKWKNYPYLPRYKIIKKKLGIEMKMKVTDFLITRGSTVSISSTDQRSSATSAESQ